MDIVSSLNQHALSDVSLSFFTPYLKLFHMCNTFSISYNFIVQYYYDPAGQMYNTRHEVDQICSDIEKSLDEKNRVVIVIDDD